MYERRRQAASPVSLLVVTLLSVWACSSGDHGDASVTTSGGAGSEVASGNSASATTQGIEAPGRGDGASEPDAVALPDAAGSGGDAPLVDAPASAGASSAELGGAGDQPAIMSDAGAATGGAATPGGPGGSTASSGGTTGVAGHAGAGAAGAPFVAPICVPADTNDTAGLYLPCNVNAVLYVCRNCHSNPPTKPASTSYVTFADIKPRAAAIADMVRTGYMPRPPYLLSEQQKRAVLTWLGQDGSCAVGVPTACQ
jgi:hypothetical protein